MNIPNILSGLLFFGYFYKIASKVLFFKSFCVWNCTDLQYMWRDGALRANLRYTSRRQKKAANIFLLFKQKCICYLKVFGKESARGRTFFQKGFPLANFFLLYTASSGSCWVVLVKRSSSVGAAAMAG
ncbi:MAG: hypothetical protein IKD22_07415, partial [Lentisphaeria bacterium]|nr:hypothetical protein [Lentisphaeria bacterium]